MKKMFLVLALSASAISLYAQQWYEQKLDEKTSISFPARPNRTDTLGQKFFIYQNPAGYYMVNVVNIGDRPDLQVKGGALGKFYDEIARGAVDASKGQIVAQHVFEIGGLKGAEVEFVTRMDPKMPDRIFKRILFYNNTIYTMDFWTTTSNRELTKADREKYFKSLTITNGEERLTQYSTESKFAKLKRKAMDAAAPAAMLLVIGLVLWLIFRKKKAQAKKK